MSENWSLRPDRMTPPERMKALLSGKPVDRVGLYPFARGFCAINTGMPLETFYSDPASSLEAQLWTQKMFNHDEVLKFGGACYGAWEFGGDIRIPTSEWQQAISVERHPVQSEEDAERLEFPDVTKAGTIPRSMEFSKLQRAAGLVCSASVGSPFMMAGNICGVERLTRWILKKPALAHRVLRLATDFGVAVAKYWVDTFGADNVDIRDSAPTDSNQVISPKHFRDFSFPYLLELHEKVLALGAKYIYSHICGEQNLNLPLWREMPFGDPGIASFGHEVDVAKAIEMLGDKCIVVGNVEPRILQTGSPQEVYQRSRECIEKGKHAPRGFILGTGCELPPRSPAANLFAMRKAINDFGWYE
jgi:uroporphyrinogen decarboxylase